MKSLARMYVWWPGMDAKIEETVKQCKQCQDSQTLPPKAPLHPWQWPSHPWTRLHIDYCGPLCGKMCLVVVDSHSKWIEAYPVSTANSTITIEKLRYLFSQFGLPQSLVSDNAPYFVSEEFESFLKSNGIKHPTSSAYHPASNGLAERAVQTLKNGLKKVRDGTLKSRIARVLFSYRIAVHSTTGRSPAEMLIGRLPRTRMDLLVPTPSVRVEESQAKQKARHDRTAKVRVFNKGDTVLVRNFPSGKGWIRGTVVKSLSPVSYRVTLDSGRVVKRHQDHLRHCTNSDNKSCQESIETPFFPSSTVDSSAAGVLHDRPTQPPVSPQPNTRRYPARDRNAPKRLTF